MNEKYEKRARKNLRAYENGKNGTGKGERRMTNAEKYKDAIMAQMYKTGDWAVNKSGKIVSCGNIDCDDCKFNTKTEFCSYEKKEWLNTEADEKKAFSEKDKEVIRALDKVNWVVRDERGVLYGYHGKPYKSRGIWFCPGDYVINLTPFTTAEFAPVKWEDDEPTSRAEILGEEE